ncbi:hypothetical protein Daus18300_009133 [Diaporthe australafricana]|uniref:Heterokaryon incompatibility domain-containing protein n=1 Tax=Diaporthe australafricana TaxID=127596 RepID=A0ABR3WFG3_9PEZI
MRLLNTTSLRFHSGEHTDFREKGYAVLSHRWMPQEITLDEFSSHVEELRLGESALSPQLEKIRGACETARSKGIKWIWIDSCCIDKRDLVETTEAINSMYRWYRGALLCIVYLYDVKKNKNEDINIMDSHIFDRLGQDKPSEWFSRGWTLQELLAPRQMEFYDKEWVYIGTKKEMKTSIANITGIDEDYLTGNKDFTTACIAQKMSWMAGRTTTKEEDIAYSMVGLFGITLTPVYGEGMRAFTRLQESLLSSRFAEESLFAWKMPAVNAGDQYNVSSDGWAADEWGLLAPSPEWFADSGGIRRLNSMTPRQVPFTMEPTGVKGPIGINPCVGKVRPWYLVTKVGLLCGIVPGLIPFFYTRHLIKKIFNEDFAFGLHCLEVDHAGRRTYVGIYLRPTLPVKRLYVEGESTILAPITHIRRARSTEFSQNPWFFKKSSTGFVPQPMPADF